MSLKQCPICGNNNAKLTSQNVERWLEVRCSVCGRFIITDPAFRYNGADPTNEPENNYNSLRDLSDSDKILLLKWIKDNQSDGDCPKITQSTIDSLSENAIIRCTDEIIASKFKQMFSSLEMSKPVNYNIVELAGLLGADSILRLKTIIEAISSEMNSPFRVLWHDYECTIEKTRFIAASSTKTTIFVASSSALADERSEMEVLVNDLNDSLNEKFVRVKWEKESLHFEEKDKQSRLNQLASDSDIFIAFVAERVGEYTKQEIEHAVEAIKSNPRKIVYVCLKDVAEKDDSREALEEWICELEQIYGTYNDPQKIRAVLYQMILKVYNQNGAIDA